MSGRRFGARARRKLNDRANSKNPPTIRQPARKSDSMSSGYYFQPGVYSSLIMELLFRSHPSFTPRLFFDTRFQIKESSPAIEPEKNRAHASI